MGHQSENRGRLPETTVEWESKELEQQRTAAKVSAQTDVVEHLPGRNINWEKGKYSHNEERLRNQAPRSSAHTEQRQKRELMI